MKHLDVLIIGGGLAGLACASKLAEVSKVVIILEAKTTLGGKLTSEEKLTAKEIVEYLELTSTTAPIAPTNPINFLARYIEQFGGEIINDAPATQIGYRRESRDWQVHTPWGELTTNPLVIALPLRPTLKMLNQVFGRERWFERAVRKLAWQPELLLQSDKLTNLYLAGDYTEPAIERSAIAALASGKRVANQILRT